MVAFTSIEAPKYVDAGEGERLSRAERAALLIREHITEARLLAGTPLREVELAGQLGVSRNTLREAFRMLGRDNLVSHSAHRGVYVSTPTEETIIDIFRVRRIIECQAVIQSDPGHPAVARLHTALGKVLQAKLDSDWQTVGTANIEFHAAIVALTDSPRLTHLFSTVSAELRLVFGLFEAPEQLYLPFVGLKAEILGLIESGNGERAASLLDEYLHSSEQLLLQAYNQVAGKV